MKNRRYCLALDLKDDPELIRQYESYHQPDGVWPEIIVHLQQVGIDLMEIYRTGNRLFMIMEVNQDFSFDKKEQMDQSNPRVQEWEALMWTFQQALPWAKVGEKWVMMEPIFQFKASD
ncbi:MAG TPA: L-rhamnose mutarotase [Saprospiraceae bacterium]|nr:L-rhamnose mutarotase [Saprospiraceae bacterium]